MPIVGESARLYFQDEIDSDPIVTGCIRKNGSTCEAMSDTANRYFATESGNYLDMLPGAISFHRSGLNVNLNDGNGITFSSPGNISISGGSVNLSAGNVSINATSQIKVQKSAGSYISLENEFYVQSSAVIENGSDRQSNPPFIDDEPTNGVAEAKKKLEQQLKHAEFKEMQLMGAMSGSEAKVKTCSEVNQEGEPKDNNVETKGGEKKGFFQNLWDKIYVDNPIPSHEDAKKRYPILERYDKEYDKIVNGKITDEKEEGLTEEQQKALNSDDMKEIKEKYPGQYGRAVQGVKDGNRVLKAAPMLLLEAQLLSPAIAIAVSAGETVTGYNWMTGEKITKKSQITEGDMLQFAMMVDLEWGGGKAESELQKNTQDINGCLGRDVSSIGKNSESIEEVANISKAGEDIANTEKSNGIGKTIENDANAMKNNNLEIEDISKTTQANKVSKSEETGVNVPKNVYNAEKVNQTNEGEGNLDFKGKLRGEEFTLKGVKMQKVNYIKRSSEARKALRRAFDTTERKNFLNKLSEDDIQDMKDGYVPEGWQVHHKLPLDDSGDNSFGNLILIKNEPYHKVITNYQKTATKGLVEGKSKIIEFPAPEGSIYPPKK